MKAYTVTASSRFFYQTLAVTAESVEDAIAAFHRELASDRAQRDEQYEYDCAVDHGPRGDNEQAPQRCDYTYSFDEDAIKVWHDARQSEPGVVRVIGSGGNG